MPFVTSIFARRVVQAAGRAVDAPSMLRSVGLDPGAPLDVGQMIAAEAYYDLLERIVRTMDDGHTLPARVGPLMRPDDYGALGLAWKSAPTVRHSLERVERFCRLWTDVVSYEVADDEEGIVFLLHRAGERRLGLRVSNECTLASATSLVRQTAWQPFRPRAVYLQHAAPAITADHEKYFGCPVHFGAPVDGLAIAADDLVRPNRLGDDGLSRFLLQHLDQEVRAVASEESLEERLRRAISRSLSAGVPRVADVARGLAMSERTLHRRLTDDGLTFRAVVDATRREMAENLLQQSQYTLSEVGFLTGFSEQSSFQRAFKRWNGQTPKAYRASHGVH